MGEVDSLGAIAEPSRRVRHRGGRVHRVRFSGGFRERKTTRRAEQSAEHLIHLRYLSPLGGTQLIWPWPCRFPLESVVVYGRWQSFQREREAYLG